MAADVVGYDATLHRSIILSVEEAIVVAMGYGRTAQVRSFSAKPHRNQHR